MGPSREHERDDGGAQEVQGPAALHSYQTGRTTEAFCFASRLDSTGVLRIPCNNGTHRFYMFSFPDARKVHNRLRWIGKTRKMAGTSGNSFYGSYRVQSFEIIFCFCLTTDKPVCYFSVSTGHMHDQCFLFITFFENLFHRKESVCLVRFPRLQNPKRCSTVYRHSLFHHAKRAAAKKHLPHHPNSPKYLRSTHRELAASVRGDICSTTIVRVLLNGTKYISPAFHSNRSR